MASRPRCFLRKKMPAQTMSMLGVCHPVPVVCALPCNRVGIKLKHALGLMAIAVASSLLVAMPLSASVTQCGLSADGTTDTCCNATGQCLTAFGSPRKSNAPSQANDLFVGDGILFQGTGWNPGVPVSIFWDPSKIGICAPPGGGTFNNAGTVETNTTCANLKCVPGEPCSPIIQTAPGTSDFGFFIPNFDAVNGPCSSYVRALQGSVEIDA